MRLLVLAAAAALMACPVAAQTPDAPPVPPRPMRDTLPPSPRGGGPMTLTELETACQRGDQPACREAGKIRANISSGGFLVPDPAPASGGGGTPPKGGRP